MDRRLLEELHEYFKNIPNKSEAEKLIFLQLTGELPHFHITGVHRDDLEHEGFDVSNVTDEQMVDLADKMSDDYCEQLFRESLSVIASEILEIPQITDPRCPECGKYMVGQYGGGSFYCDACGHEWEVVDKEK